MSDISVYKKLILRSGATYDLGTVPCEAEPKCGELWYQKECYFLADYAKENLKEIKSERYGCTVYEFTAEDAAEIIKLCNIALRADERALPTILPIGEYGKNRYNGYDENFYRDVKFCINTLSVVLQDLGNPDVLFELIVC